MNKAKPVKRDKNNLLSGVVHHFDENGMVDWRKMVDRKYLYPNPTSVARGKVAANANVDDLADNDLCILLAGLKELAHIRGYTSVRYDVSTPSADFVVATCTISWIPNYETEGREVTFSAAADASPSNTNGFGQNFLATGAENRAFSRCIRNFLRVHVVSVEELKEGINPASYRSRREEEAPVSASPQSMLESLMKEKGVKWETLKNSIQRDSGELGLDAQKAESYQGVEDIPKNAIFRIVQKMKNAKVVKK